MEKLKRTGRPAGQLTGHCSSCAVILYYTSRLWVEHNKRSVHCARFNSERCPWCGTGLLAAIQPWMDRKQPKGH